MRNRSRLASLLALGGVACVLLVVACSDDGRPEASSSPNPQPTSTSTAPPLEAGADGPEGCALTPQLGAVIEEQLLRETPVPKPFGGLLLDGTYLLQEMFTYSQSDAGVPDSGDPDEPPPPPPIPTGTAGRSTLVVAAGALRFVGARGLASALPTDAVRALRYQASGAELKTESVCPAGAATEPLGYSVVGNKLSLLVDGKRREVFVRRD